MMPFGVHMKKQLVSKGLLTKIFGGKKHLLQATVLTSS